jgi:hypothetical protein
MAGEDWSQKENDLIVADYLEMLRAHLSGLKIMKSVHRRELQKFLNDRSEKSIEYKYCNISAALQILGIPQYVPGYRPLANIQRSLLKTVADQLELVGEIFKEVEADVEEVPAPPNVDDILSILTSPPKPKVKTDAVADLKRSNGTRFVDYASHEARNRKLGLLGEEFVVRYEEARLLHAGQKRLASRIQHVAKLRGDGDGYDILSFEVSGRERFIEVKTTKYAIETPFYVTRNEEVVSREKSDRYHLYRLFSFGASPRLFTLTGPLSIGCSLEPQLYRATVA